LQAAAKTDELVDPVAFMATNCGFEISTPFLDQWTGSFRVRQVLEPLSGLSAHFQSLCKNSG
jgi:hypothetical protein